MTRKTFRIRVRNSPTNPDGVDTRTGWVHGAFAAYREPYAWMITHIPSGFAVNVYPPPETATQAKALLVAWNNPANIPAHTRDNLAKYATPFDE